MYGRKVIAAESRFCSDIGGGHYRRPALVPVSATQTLVGAVLGVGLARGIGALNLHVVRNILLSWLITIPATSLLAVLFFYCFQNI
jgi:phosphate/sulfate permease